MRKIFFHPLPGYIERIDCEEVVGFYLTPKEIQRILTPRAVIRCAYRGAHIILAKPNGQIDQQ